MTPRSTLIVFLVLVLGGGTLLGFLIQPGPWYAGLAKPSFNPPAFVFAPTWTVLYVMIAIAGWRVWEGGHRVPMALWWTQLVLNFLWTPVFFGAHRIGAALVVIALLFATILAFIASARRVDRGAAVLFVPYALWVGFASLLNAALWRLNPGAG